MNNILDTAHCKVSGTHLNLHRWKSWEANTPFAPNFDCPIWVEDLNNFFIKNLIEEIENKKFNQDLANYFGALMGSPRDPFVAPMGLRRRAGVASRNTFGFPTPAKISCRRVPGTTLSVKVNLDRPAQDAAHKRVD